MLHSVVIKGSFDLQKSNEVQREEFCNSVPKMHGSLCPMSKQEIFVPDELF